MEELSINFWNGNKLINNLQVFNELKKILNSNTSIEILTIGVIISRCETAVLVPLSQVRVLSQQQVHDILAYNKFM
jgi:hypothetical protein